jgi:hypothetical protein
MTHLFVPYDIALILKNKGFDEICFRAYRNTDGEKLLMATSEWTNSGNGHYEKVEGYCAAPLYQQVIDWFREVHKIHILIWSFDHGYDMNREHRYVPIIDYDLFKALKPSQYPPEPKEEYTDYYEALTAAINHAITLIP